MDNDYLYSFIISLIEYLKIFLVYWGICGLKPSKSIYSYIFTIIPTTIITLLFVGFSGIETLEALIFVFGCIIPVFCFQGKFIKKFFLYFVIVIIISCMDAYLYTFPMILTNSNIDMFMNNRIMLISGNLFTLTIFIVILITRLRSKITIIDNDPEMIFSQYLLMTIGIIFCGLVVAGTQSMMLNILSDRQQLLVFTAINSACIIFFLLSIWLIRVTTSRNFYKKQQIIQAEYIHMQDEYYKEVIDRERQLRSFRHDLRSHMIAIQDLIRREDLSYLLEYTNRILNETNNMCQYKYSTNPIIDAIANDIMKHVDSSRIQLVWNGQLPKKIKIDMFDLCTVFSNLIKNAVEACMKLPEDKLVFITVETGMFERILSIRISNPILEPIKLTNGKPVSSKKDKLLHGFGLQNIENTVVKYNGMINYIPDDKSFTVEILMHQY